MGQPLLLDVLDEREERYEVIDGHVVVSPPARREHERLQPKLAALLLGAVPSGLEVLGPNFAVRYDPLVPRSFLLPDLVVVRTEDGDDFGVSVPPLLVVEILSPGTRRRDRGEKQEIYAQLGVPHYWLVDPDAGEVEALELRDGRFVLEQAGPVVELSRPFPVRVDLPALG